MSVLFGHPAGNPNAHHAALAHFDAGRLAAFCVPWMPSAGVLNILNALPPLRSMAGRLARRHFAPLEAAPLVQGRAGEVRRLLLRTFGRGGEHLSYEANDWLMRIMVRECRRVDVTAVHAYEDCSLWQFSEARRLGKACIYDMPIGYYPAWEQTEAQLARKYAEWLPARGLPSAPHVRPTQKRQEMELADLVLVPSAFVEATVRAFHPDKTIRLAPYGIDTDAWPAALLRAPRETMTFLFVGGCSVRKGVPLLLKAWTAAGLKQAKLLLVGPWQLAEHKLKELPADVEWTGPLPPDMLRTRYGDADLLVLPTNFEGRALVIGEALASSLPVLTTPACGAQDLISDDCGRLVQSDDLDALVESLRWFSSNRHILPAMGRAARTQAERSTWAGYRRRVADAVAPFV